MQPQLLSKGKLENSQKLSEVTLRKKIVAPCLELNSCSERFSSSRRSLETGSKSDKNLSLFNQWSFPTGKFCTKKYFERVLSGERSLSIAFSLECKEMKRHHIFTQTSHFSALVEVQNGSDNSSTSARGRLFQPGMITVPRLLDFNPLLDSFQYDSRTH